MQIITNTGNHVEGSEALSARVSSAVEIALGGFRDHISRVEVHLSDQNSGKGGQFDKRCMMEARIEGRQPMAITHDAETLYGAIEGGADKLRNAIESALERQRDRDQRRTDPPDGWFGSDG